MRWAAVLSVAPFLWVTGALAQTSAATLGEINRIFQQERRVEGSAASLSAVLDMQAITGRVLGETAGFLTPSQRQRFDAAFLNNLALEIAGWVEVSGGNLTVQPSGPARPLASGGWLQPFRVGGTRVGLAPSGQMGMAVFTEGADGRMRMVDAEFGGVSLVETQVRATRDIWAAAGGNPEVFLSAMEIVPAPLHEGR